MSEPWPSTWSTGYGPPPLGDKLVDWEALRAVGGQPALFNKRVLEIGPGFGIDALMHAHVTESYTIIDTSHRVIDDMVRWQRIMGTPLHAVQLDAAEMADFFLRTTTPMHSDVILDFSSIDNIPNPYKIYEQCCEILAPGGLILTTFANSRMIEAGVNNEQAIDPWELCRFFRGKGLMERLVSAGPRAAVCARRR